MKNQSTIPYLIDNRTTDIKAMIWAVGIALCIPLMLILGLAIGLPLSIIGVILLTKGLNKSDGKVRIVQNDSNRGVAIFEDSKTGTIEEYTFHKKEFSWHYMYHPSTARNSVDGPSHINYTELMLTFHLVDGRKIGLIEGLYPWQEIPANWAYSLFDKQDYSELYIASGLKDYKKEIGEKLLAGIS